MVDDCFTVISISLVICVSHIFDTHGVLFHHPPHSLILLSSPLDLAGGIDGWMNECEHLCFYPLEGDWGRGEVVEAWYIISFTVGTFLRDLSTLPLLDTTVMKDINANSNSNFLFLAFSPCIVKCKN